MHVFAQVCMCVSVCVHVRACIRVGHYVIKSASWMQDGGYETGRHQVGCGKAPVDNKVQGHR